MLTPQLRELEILESWAIKDQDPEIVGGQGGGRSLWFPGVHSIWVHEGRHSGLMVSALVSRLSSLGLNPGCGHCLVYLGKTLTVLMGSGKLDAGGNPAMD